MDISVCMCLSCAIVCALWRWLYNIFKQRMQLTQKAKQSTVGVVDFESFVKAPYDIMPTRGLSPTKDKSYPVMQ